MRARVTIDLRQTPSLTLALLVLIVLVLTRCNSRKTACLDPEATNFDVTADRDDRSMCLYPNLLLDVSYAYGDTNFARERLYQNNLGQDFAVTQLYILFSQFQLIGDEIGRKMVIDDVEWVVEPNNVTSVANDFTFVDNLRFIYPVGMWNMSDMIHEMRFTVGVPDTLTPTNADSLADNNKLNDGRAYYNEAQQQFATARFTIVRDSLEAAPSTIVVSSGPISYSYPLSKRLQMGEDDTVRVKVEFETLFGETDLSTDSTAIAAQLAERLKDAIINNN